MRASVLVIACLALSACESRWVEVVVQSCIRDGQPASQCECTAKGMKQALGHENYAVFTDIILISGESAPGEEKMLSIMQEYGMAPGHLEQTLAEIQAATKQVYKVCNG